MKKQRLRERITQVELENSFLSSLVRELRAEISTLDKENDTLRAGGSVSDASTNDPNMVGYIFQDDEWYTRHKFDTYRVEFQLSEMHFRVFGATECDDAHARLATEGQILGELANHPEYLPHYEAWVKGGRVMKRHYNHSGGSHETQPVHYWRVNLNDHLTLNGWGTEEAVRALMDGNFQARLHNDKCYMQADYDKWVEGGRPLEKIA